MACTECRQQKINTRADSFGKVKCDVDDNSGRICLRCRRHKIECVYSKTYKRQRRPTYATENGSMLRASRD
ncbi:hypothetical protein AC579_9306 [Pseudocercospora musae]|uniref:Zn(2)-C6 fungal-type domain-containing protein n=1 Tax=Pseudocercospora musae TaxID=113226 RepID=A0A139I5D0_9PEZI|nr:hypothetical protein AC579_9306 [Pseudocercospora musae]